MVHSSNEDHPTTDLGLLNEGNRDLPTLIKKSHIFELFYMDVLAVITIYIYMLTKIDDSNNLATVVALFIPVDLVIWDGMNFLSKLQNKISDWTMVFSPVQV